MEPGHVFELRDPSARARSAMSAAASQWSRGTGAVFATGKSWEEINGWMTHVGWWCCRIDGVEIEPPDPTWRQQEAAAEYAARQAERRARHVSEGRGKRIQRQRIEPVQPLAVATEWSQPVATAGEYADWDKPREPGEVF